MTFQINLNKLALGTAQFGFNYGISNQSGQVSHDEAQKILTYAEENGLDTLDTAIGYGNSERILGDIGISNWETISKLPAIPDECLDIESWIDDAINESLKRLRTKQLSGLLLHNPDQLLKKKGEVIYDVLVKLKDDNVVNKIGISIYDPHELDLICPNYHFDIVQAPLNIFDRRLVNSGWLKRLAEQEIEVHVRSVFMQGLLLMSPDNRPSKFKKWDSLWNSWREWLKKVELTPLEVCLSYALNQLEINRVLVGVESLVQFKEILQAVSCKLVDIPEELQCGDIELVNPALWNSL
jgi:aryl-alcohol dehydrogenase-like predicted oxidoreductase